MNTGALDVPWIAEANGRAHRHFGFDLCAEKRDLDAHTADFAGCLDAVRRDLRWSRRVPLDTHLAHLGSHPLFLPQGDERGAACLAEERRHVPDVFPDGIVEETYDVLLLLATTSPTSAA